MSKEAGKEEQHLESSSLKRVKEQDDREDSIKKSRLNDVELPPSENNQSSSRTLNLTYVREQLIRLEETIIFALIERAQFARNSAIYAHGKDSLLAHTTTLSYRDFLFSKTENLHASVGRYHSWDENSFFDHDNVNTIGKVSQSDTTMNPRIKPNSINLNHKIRSVYDTYILPGICPVDNDDKHYGSSSLSDIAILQAVSRRVHFGKLVAEVKFRANRERYIALIKARDAASILKELEVPHIEKQVVNRVQIKASTYGTDPTQTVTKDQNPKVAPSLIATLYRNYVMPLNKEVQVNYLMERLDQNIVAYISDAPYVGSNYETAVEIFGTKIPFQRVTSINGAFSAVLSNHVDHAIVPIEKNKKVCDLTQEKLMSKGLLVSAEYYFRKTNERFFVISKKCGIPSGTDKTTIVCGVKHQAGALSRTLKIFANKGVNLTCIQSLPNPASTLGYDFYLEFEGHIKNTNVEEALANLNKEATYIKFLGSYADMSKIL